MHTTSHSRTARSLIAVACTLACLSVEAATIKVTSRDPAGFGFNDPTPVKPVGGNMGTTLGEQRMNVYRHVAEIWGRQLQSNVEITVSAGWENLDCDATSAVLGSAGAWNIWILSQAGGVNPTLYPQALANKLIGRNLSASTPDDGSGYGNVDIKTQFNARLGEANCLDGSPFYLGLDGNEGDGVDFAATLLHELGHGLGFSVLGVNTATGSRLGGYASIWERFMYDNTAGKTWQQMTNAERAASAINPEQLAWIGSNTVNAAAITLSPQPVVKSATPAGAVPTAPYSPSTFGPAVPSTVKLGALAVVVGQDGCTPLNAANAAAAKGKVPLIDRGGCDFTVKVKNAQDVGAVGVILVNNRGGSFTPGGSNSAIRIPSVGITQGDGAILKAAVAAAKPYGSRSQPGQVTASLAIDPSRKAGADRFGRPLLYTPSTLIGGSSVSHFDVSALPNLLMEPNISSDLTLEVNPPKDLTLPLLKDLGW